MSAVMEDRDIYLSRFERFEKGQDHDRPWLRHLRSAAIDRFAELGFPTPRDEEWRFTNVAPITRVAFQPAAAVGLSGQAVQALQRLSFDTGTASTRIVFVNGHFAPALSALRPSANGVTVDSLAGVLKTHSKWVEPHLARYAGYEDHPFRALNTAFLRDGAFVSIPKGKVVEEPVHLVFVSTTRGEPTVSYPRNLIVAGPGSRATVIESYIGLEDGVYLTNAVTEIVAGENSVIDHYKLQREGGQAFHVATLQVHQERGSNFSSHYVALGGALVRNEVNVALDGEGCESTLNGLYLARDRQHMDNRTVIDHAKPRCASHELYKGILDGKAHGVFNGKIFVRQDAQKTDAKQTNKTLLLSDDATINTKPQLEIFADDVKCTHGATVGQLDAESIFYLRSRGIDLAAARSLLTFAFANDVIGRIKVEPLRAGLEDLLLAAQHLPTDDKVKEAP
ncbi:MAG TPA: Fe-S cluster assembly protein SufD [Gemmataceae bacterium]|jgi:Fe-S cluster assembly protein SufD|nr:Fe-S cluster assembly protein SufD [Gemmataceae bacterium]